MNLQNWPPSRGERNPNDPDEDLWIPGEVTREDLEPLPRPVPTHEQSEIEATLSGDEPEEVDEFVFRHPEPKALVGAFRCNYSVEAVGTLTLEQACRMIHVHERTRKDFDEGTRTGVTEFSGREAIWGYLVQPRTLMVEIDYPLSKRVRLVVPPMRRRWVYSRDDAPIPDGEQAGERTREKSLCDPGYLLWVVAREYQRIYREHEKYGVWGHAIGDLWFEGFEIAADGSTVLWMGS